MVLNRLAEPQSKLSTFNNWRKRQYIELVDEKQNNNKSNVSSISPLSPPPSLNLNDYYRAMDSLSESIEGIKKSLFYQRRTLFEDKELVFFDTTSTYFEGDRADQSAYGLSKDHRPDRKQVVVSLVLNEDRIPISHKIWEGNTVDKKAFREAVRELKNRFNVKRAVLVADRGCVSRDIALKQFSGTI